MQFALAAIFLLCELNNSVGHCTRPGRQTELEWDLMKQDLSNLGCMSDRKKM